MPSLAVVVCTRNRGSRVIGAVRSILAAAAGDVEVLVIDQSDDHSVESALSAFAQTRTTNGEPVAPRVTYVRTDTRGLAAARNVGLRLARSPIVAMTDDDCTVGSEWQTSLAQPLLDHPAVVLVFGTVRAAALNPHDGFIPSYDCRLPMMATGLAQKALVEGVGACMAIRRDIVIELGGFDEMLGVGAPYCAGEEVDLTLRVLSAGHAVCETPRAFVVHQGARPWASVHELIQSYWFGSGAAIGKLLQSERVAALTLLARLGWRFVTGESPVSKSFRPRGLAWLQVWSFLRGLGTGALTPVDPTTGHFIVETTSRRRASRAGAGMRRGARQSPDPSRIRS